MSMDVFNWSTSLHIFVTGVNDLENVQV